MDLLKLTAGEIEAAGAYWTAREIAQQPQLWPQIAQLVSQDSALGGFLAQWDADARPRVVLTGAGTSSFIGECLAPSLVRRGGWPQAEAIATTDIVASPGSFLRRHTP